MRLISITGEQLGVVTVREALAMAEEQDVDLVEISPTAKPPVCKLMDFGKYKYEQAKKRDEAKKKQKQVQKCDYVRCPFYGGNMQSIKPAETCMAGKSDCRMSDGRTNGQGAD